MDEPPQETPPDAAPWRGWVDRDNDPVDQLGSSSLVEVTVEGEVVLINDVEMAEIYSPVFDTESPTVLVAEPIELWPPNHEYVSLTLDECVDEVFDAVRGAPLDQGDRLDAEDPGQDRRAGRVA